MHAHTHGHARADTYQNTKCHKHKQNPIWQVSADSLQSAHSFHSAHCGLAGLNRRAVGRDVISRRLYDDWWVSPLHRHQHKLSLSLKVQIVKNKNASQLWKLHVGFVKVSGSYSQIWPWSNQKKNVKKCWVATKWSMLLDYMVATKKHNRLPK